MLALKIWELPGFMATVIGLARANFVFAQSQAHNNGGERVGLLLSINYPEAPRPVAAILARFALPEKACPQIQQNRTLACSWFSTC